MGASRPIRFGPAWEEDAIGAAAALRAVDPDLDTRFELPIKIAFQKFGLDQSNPNDWRTLLTYFAFAHFGQTTVKRGRKTKWDAKRLCQLLSDIADKRRSRPSQSESQIYRFLLKDSSLKRRYRGETGRSHKLAVDPGRNEVLAIILNEFEQLWFSEIKRMLPEGQGALSDEDIRHVVRTEALSSAIHAIERYGVRTKDGQKS